MPYNHFLAKFEQSSFRLPEDQASHLMLLLDATISERTDLQRRLHQLAGQEAELSTKIELLRSLTHPFKRLPRELYEEIFLACLPTTHLPTLSSNEAPLVLLRVCRAWREIAMDTPQLCSSVHIAVPLRMNAAQGNLVAQRVQTHMERARSLPMVVSLWAPTIAQEDYDLDSCNAIVQCLWDNSSRIVDLKLDVPDDILLRLTNRGPSHAWGALERITLDCHPTNQYDWGRGANTRNLSFWSSAALRSVTMMYVHDNLLRFPIRWEGLQQLLMTSGSDYKVEVDAAHRDGTELSVFTGCEARAVLSSCPALANLRICLGERAEPLQGTPPSFLVIDPSPPLIHNHLTALQLNGIVGEGSGGASSFLEGLQLPSLRRLSYSLVTTAEHPWNEFPHILNHPLRLFLTSQSHPIRITKLTLWKRMFAAESLIGCLKLIPSLEDLWIRSGVKSSQEFGDGFLEAFFPVRMRQNANVTTNTDLGDGGPSTDIVQQVTDGMPEELEPPCLGLCPRLHTMRIEKCNFTPEAIRHFVLSRLDFS